MTKPKDNPCESDHRILVDMSAASGGYTGIPHEARLNLDAIWRTPGLTPTGLLFDDGKEVLSHRFNRGVHPGQRMENHAVFLFQVAQRSQGAGLTKKWLWKRWQTIRRYLFGRNVRRQYLDNAVHAESVWRIFLEKSLGASGLELAGDCPMLLANLSRSALKLRAFRTLPTFRLNTAEFDFLLLHESMPIRVNAETCKLIRLYDLIPGVRPELVDSRRQIVAHMRGIRSCRHDSVFVCASEPTRSDLLNAFPETEDRAVVIPAVLGNQLFVEKGPRRLAQIVRSRRAELVPAKTPGANNRVPPYLLTVCSIEPRKNHLALIRAYSRLTARRETDLILIFVGSAGWQNAEVLREMKPLIEQSKLIYLERVPTDELRILYSHAESVVFPSCYEGFGYAPLEGMQCGTPALVSDIAAHRWVYGDAAMYFDPFDPEEISEAIEKLVFTQRAVLRPQLIENGFRRIGLYESKVIGEQWRSLCDEIRRQGGGRKVTSMRLAKLKLTADHPIAPQLRLAA